MPESPGAVQFLDDGSPPTAWRPTADVTFTWTPATHGASPVVAYYWSIDQSPTASAAIGWSSTAQTKVSLTLAGQGTWYFHVAAYNQAGSLGPTSTLPVRYNAPPGVPGAASMTANGQDAVSQVPLFAATAAVTLAWSPASDPFGGPITYDVQFAATADFGESPGVNAAREFANVASNSLNLAQPLGRGRWFWRIRASDGVQFGEWSRTGSFEHNTPPGPPLGLEVVNT